MIEVFRIPNAEYHQPDGHLSSTGLRKFAANPAHYKAVYLDRVEPDEDEEDDNLTIGSLTHSLVLEPELTEQEFARFPQALLTRKRSVNRKLREEWRQQERRVVLSEQHWRLAEAMRDAILSHKAGRAIVRAAGHAELSIYWMDHGVRQKARLDKLLLREQGSWLVDLKTTGRWWTSFDESMVKYGYLLQACHYVAAVEFWTGVRPRFFFLIVEKSAEHMVALREVSAEELRAGEVLRRAILQAYAECLRTGVWPETPVGIPQRAEQLPAEQAAYYPM